MIAFGARAHLWCWGPLCYKEGTGCPLFSSLYSPIMTLWCSEKCCSPSLESPIHEFDWGPLGHSPAATALIPLLFPWHFLPLSPFFFGDSPQVLCTWSKACPYFEFFLFHFWRAWWEELPAPSNLHLFCNDLRLWLFSLMSYSLSVITTDFLALTAHGHLDISSGGSLAVVWELLEVSCCLVVAANSFWRDVHITGMTLMCLPKILGMACLTPLACILTQAGLSIISKHHYPQLMFYYWDEKHVLFWDELMYF